MSIRSESRDQRESSIVRPSLLPCLQELNNRVMRCVGKPQLPSGSKAKWSKILSRLGISGGGFQRGKSVVDDEQIARGRKLQRGDTLIPLVSLHLGSGLGDLLEETCYMPTRPGAPLCRAGLDSCFLKPLKGRMSCNEALCRVGPVLHPAPQELARAAEDIRHIFIAAFWSKPRSAWSSELPFPDRAQLRGLPGAAGFEKGRGCWCEHWTGTQEPL